MMKASKNVKALIKHHETLCLIAYRCPSGVPTIGWGHTGATTGGILDGSEITYDQAQALFDMDIRAAEESVRRLLADGIRKGVVEQCRFDAFVSFVFNIGETKARGYTLTKLLNAGAPDSELVEWWPKYSMSAGRKLRGLVRRRMGELLISQALPWEVTDDDGSRGFRVELDTPFRTVQKWAAAEAAKREELPAPPKKQMSDKSVKIEELGLDQTESKPLEDSERGRGFANEVAGEETAKIGGVLSVTSLMAFIQQLATTQNITNVFLFVLMICLVVVAFGLIRRGYGRNQKANGRAEASQTLH